MTNNMCSIIFDNGHCIRTSFLLIATTAILLSWTLRADDDVRNQNKDSK